MMEQNATPIIYLARHNLPKCGGVAACHMLSPGCSSWACGWRGWFPPIAAGLPLCTRQSDYHSLFQIVNTRP